MISWSRRGLGLRHFAAALVAGSVAALGCGSKSQPEAAPSSPDKAPAAQTAAAHKPNVSPEPPPARPKAAAVRRDRLHQAFGDATLGPDNPPADCKPPVDQTVTGKSGPRLLEQVRHMWDQVAFVSLAGKKIHYTADVVTDRGTITIALLPELAPNHVRNFIVLARIGYFDGLRFDRIHNEVGENARLCQIEAGCPAGTGETGTGSIGYWMKDELTGADKLRHDVGVVGACRLVEADSAATKFYINLEKAAYLDGTDTLFAKVVAGLDVARIIAQEPVARDSEDALRASPIKPVVIHQVTIHEHETEAVEK
jgi:peptidyl-prolyl cis-trans isomerase B (cyclophilin B)